MAFRSLTERHGGRSLPRPDPTESGNFTFLAGRPPFSGEVVCDRVDTGNVAQVGEENSGARFVEIDSPLAIAGREQVSDDDVQVAVAGFVGLDTVRGVAVCGDVGQVDEQAAVVAFLQVEAFAAVFVSDHVIHGDPDVAVAKFLDVDAFLAIAADVDVQEIDDQMTSPRLVQVESFLEVVEETRMLSVDDDIAAIRFVDIHAIVQVRREQEAVARDIDVGRLRLALPSPRSSSSTPSAPLPKIEVWTMSALSCQPALVKPNAVLVDGARAIAGDGAVPDAQGDIGVGAERLVVDVQPVAPHEPAFVARPAAAGFRSRIARGLRMLSSMSDVTQILSAIEQGDRHAAEKLLPLVYDELRKLAAARMAEEPSGNTMDATALVHEAYLRLVRPADAARWDNRGHFFAAAAEAMRRILVEAARRKQRAKHGGDRQRIDLDANQPAAPDDREDLVALDAALTRLEAEDPQAAKLVELRHFTGLSVAEAALALGISPRTADRVWAFARAWLHRELADAPADPQP